MSFADALQKAVNKINQIPGIGVDVTLRRITLGSYNTSTGEIAETASDSTVKGVFEEGTQREVNGLVQADDRKCMISASSVSNVPTTKDKIIYNSVTYQVISVKTVSQAGVDLSYELVLRA